MFTQSWSKTPVNERNTIIFWDDGVKKVAFRLEILNPSPS